MDPPPLINHSTFSPANPSSYSLSEIWPPNFPLFPPPPHSSPSLLTIPDASADESSLTHHHTPTHSPSPNRRKRKDPITVATSDDDSSKHDSSCKRKKLGGSMDENGGLQDEAEASSAAGNKSAEQSAKPSGPPKQDYIHVRARRGQATDSHSLAERARREKISERMKILQDLVPGSSKVIGKALVLDEIINYIQSLQRQIEFLSMKLEAINSRLNMNPTIESFPSKDPFDLAGVVFGSQVARGYAQGSQPGWLHMQIGGGFERAT